MELGGISEDSGIFKWKIVVCFFFLYVVDTDYYCFFFGCVVRVLNLFLIRRLIMRLC